jgi:hypothetical protein
MPTCVAEVTLFVNQIMNEVAISQSQSTLRQRAAWHLLSLVGALAIALTAAMTLAIKTTPPAVTTRAGSQTEASRFNTFEDSDTVVFYLTPNSDATERIVAFEELGQWIRHDSGVRDPKRSVVVLDVSSDGARSRARDLMDRAMAAANYALESGPTFVVVELP